MDKIWFPQRNEIDSTSAILKNFIHYLNFPLSKFTIEQNVVEHPDFPQHVSLATILALLEKWGIKHKPFKCPLDRVKDIQSPSILFLNDSIEGNAGDFIMYYAMHENVVEYLDTRKGWVLEDIEDFGKKFANIALSAFSLDQPEIDFEAREKEYDRQKLANPDLSNVRIVDDFLTDKECEYIIQLSTPLFERSMFMVGNERVLDEGRTSFSAELHVFPNDEILNAIQERASKLIDVPANHFEYFQCLSYDKKQEIEHHYDTFDENSEGGRKVIAEGGQRKYTMLAYLNDDFEGGATYFPELDYMVQPKKRRVLIFNNLDENGNILKCSWHGGLPVKSGRKFAMNMWVRNKPVR